MVWAWWAAGYLARKSLPNKKVLLCIWRDLFMHKWSNITRSIESGQIVMELSTKNIWNLVRPSIATRFWDDWSCLGRIKRDTKETASKKESSLSSRQCETAYRCNHQHGAVHARVGSNGTSIFVAHTWPLHIITCFRTYNFIFKAQSSIQHKKPLLRSMYFFSCDHHSYGEGGFGKFSKC